MSAKTTLTIGIRDLRIDTVIGVHYHERTQTQPILISLMAEIAVKLADDKLQNTVSYADFPDLIRRAAKSEPQLLETLAEDVLTATLAYDPRILSAEIEIQKPQAVPGAACSFIKMQKKR